MGTAAANLQVPAANDANESFSCCANTQAAARQWSSLYSGVCFDVPLHRAGAKTETSKDPNPGWFAVSVKVSLSHAK